MSEQWKGLHYHDRHFYSPGYGDRCGKCWYCSPETPCYCCLAAEVEALRAQNAALIGMVERDTAAIQRVRRLRDTYAQMRDDVLDGKGGPTQIGLGVLVNNLNRILDGGDA